MVTAAGGSRAAGTETPAALRRLTTPPRRDPVRLGERGGSARPLGGAACRLARRRLASRRVAAARGLAARRAGRLLRAGRLPPGRLAGCALAPRRLPGRLLRRRARTRPLRARRLAGCRLPPRGLPSGRLPARGLPCRRLAGGRLARARRRAGRLLGTRLLPGGLAGCRLPARRLLAARLSCSRLAAGRLARTGPLRRPARAGLGCRNGWRHRHRAGEVVDRRPNLGAGERAELVVDALQAVVGCTVGMHRPLLVHVVRGPVFAPSSRRGRGRRPCTWCADRIPQCVPRHDALESRDTQARACARDRGTRVGTRTPTTGGPVSDANAVTVDVRRAPQRFHTRLPWLDS